MPTVRRKRRKLRRRAASPRPKVKGPSRLEKRFVALWRAAGGPPLETEVKFHPTRKWRADFAHADSRTLIEIEGGVFSGGRHTRGTGYVKDCEKYLAAWLLNYSVIRLTAPQLTPATVAEIARKLSPDSLVSPAEGGVNSPVGSPPQLSHKNPRVVGQSLCRLESGKKIPFSTLKRLEGAVPERLTGRYAAVSAARLAPASTL